MSADTERYRERQFHFNAKAKHCPPEIAALWREIASSYQFLADREEASERERADRGSLMNAVGGHL